MTNYMTLHYKYLRLERLMKKIKNENDLIILLEKMANINVAMDRLRSEKNCAKFVAGMPSP